MTDWELRARELIGVHWHVGESYEQSMKEANSIWCYALQLGNEMADARAEEIALRCERVSREPELQYPELTSDNARYAMCKAAQIARSFISKKPEPKTREQVLEDALREIEKPSPFEGSWNELLRKRELALRALEWKANPDKLPGQIKRHSQ